MSFIEESHIHHISTGTRRPCPLCDQEVDFSPYKPLSMVNCPHCGSTILVPAQLAHYELNHLLGEGAVGRVYRARDPKLERDVAVKILREDLNATPSMWKMLENEAKLAAGISHHNVIQVYTMGKLLGRPYIVMELALEKSLEERMYEEPISEPEAIQVGWDVLQGLQAAANNRLMHGDVKPANIMMGPPGYTKITDFGLARFLQEGQDVERWGTPYYIAPEKSQQVQEDFRSDIYSLGATLFHAVAGRAPFEGNSGEEVIQKSLKKTTPKLRDVQPEVSQGFSDVIRTMIARNPDDRFYSYAQVIHCFYLLRDGTFDSKVLKELKPPSPGVFQHAWGRFVTMLQDEPIEEEPLEE